MLKIKILKANNVNTVNTQPAELMQSTKSVDVSTETMSKTIFFPEFSYEVVRVKLMHTQSTLQQQRQYVFSISGNFGASQRSPTMSE